jgi:uncharacterized protein YkwD
MTSKRIVPVVCIAVVVVAAIGLFAFARAAQPTYQPERNGVALGPSVQHAPAASDVLVQVATGALSTAAGSSSGALPPIGNYAATPDEQSLLDMTNADRTQNGLPPLAFDEASLQVARVRAAAQIPDGPLSHYNSLGALAFVGLLEDAGLGYSLAGENLARASTHDTTTVAQLNEALMNSPTHRANILEPSFNLLAVGAADGSGGRLAFAEIFRSSRQ